MTYVDCPKTNFQYLVISYLRGNRIEDYSKFETGYDRPSDKPTITKWEYELKEPTVDYLINDRYPIYKSSIRIMKQNESKDLFKYANNLLVTVMQKIHINKNIEMNCLQALYPELFLTDSITNK